MQGSEKAGMWIDNATPCLQTCEEQKSSTFRRISGWDKQQNIFMCPLIACWNQGRKPAAHKKELQIIKLKATHHLRLPLTFGNLFSRTWWRQPGTGLVRSALVNWADPDSTRQPDTCVILLQFAIWNVEQSCSVEKPHPLIVPFTCWPAWRLTVISCFLRTASGFVFAGLQLWETEGVWKTGVAVLL